MVPNLTRDGWGASMHACKSCTNSEGTTDLEKKAVEQEARTALLIRSEQAFSCRHRHSTGCSIQVEGLMIRPYISQTVHLQFLEYLKVSSGTMENG